MDVKDRALQDHLVMISVSTEFEIDELDPDDVADGECTFLGDRWVLVEDVPNGACEEAVHDAALDVFHEDIGIANLDDFLIQPRSATQDEIDAGQVYWHSITFDPARHGVDDLEPDGP